MVIITYLNTAIVFSLIWVIIRTIFALKSRKLLLKREFQLLFVYICLIVSIRFTFFPFSKVNGMIQPLILNFSRIYPFRINLLPFVNLFDYPIFQEAILNLVGNITMFISAGIIWPLVYKELNTPARAIFAGIGISLFIELMQLPFYDRVTDIDDLILNTIGYLVGYSIFILIRHIIIKARN